MTHVKLLYLLLGSGNNNIYNELEILINNQMKNKCVKKKYKII